MPLIQWIQQNLQPQPHPPPPHPPRPTTAGAMGMGGGGGGGGSIGARLSPVERVLLEQFELEQEQNPTAGPEKIPDDEIDEIPDILIEIPRRVRIAIPEVAIRTGPTPQELAERDAQMSRAGFAGTRWISNATESGVRTSLLCFVGAVAFGRGQGGPLVTGVGIATLEQILRHLGGK